MDIVEKDSEIFVISEKGYGKKTAIKHFTKHRRGGFGIRSAVVNDKTGKLVGVKSLTKASGDILIISNKGQTIRLSLKDIPSMGRSTQGVRIMRLNEGDKVAASALLLEPEEDEEPEQTELVKDTKKKPAKKTKKAPAKKTKKTKK